MKSLRTIREMFNSALIVTSNPGHAKVDRGFLKRTGIGVGGIGVGGTSVDGAEAGGVVESGDKALRFLKKHGADLIICDTTLTDMDGCDFIRLLKADPAFASIPVLMTGVDVGREAVLDAVKLGCAGYLVRPYSQAAFHKHLQLAAHAAAFAREERAALRAAGRVAANDPDAAVKVLETVEARPDEAPRYFKEGMRFLAQEKYDPAILSFNKAVELNAVFAEAYMGLAEAWLGKGNQRNYRKYLGKAADVCTRQRRYRELRERFVEMLKHDGDGFNPFFAAGNEAVRERDYKAALAALANAADLTPERGDIYVEMSKTYHFLRRPEQAVKAVTKGLELQGDNSAGRDLYRRFTGKEYGALPTMEEFQSEAQPREAKLPLFMRGVLFVAALALSGLGRGKPEYA